MHLFSLIFSFEHFIFGIVFLTEEDDNSSEYKIDFFFFFFIYVDGGEPIILNIF